MKNLTLSIVIPVYNEEKTIGLILNRIIKVRLVNGMSKEILIVDDGSKDKTPAIIRQFMLDNPQEDISFFEHEVNQGKGAAVITGIQKATGNYLIIQDADLEYDPEDYNKMLKPVFVDGAHVVYGSRFKGDAPHRVLFFMHSIGNKILTLFSNIFTNLNLTDVHTCYKLFETPLIKSIPLMEKDFAFCPEVTAKIARIPSIKIFEVGISYYGRTYQEGKKIKWRDGFRAIYTTIKYTVFLRKRILPNGIETLRTQEFGQNAKTKKKTPFPAPQKEGSINPDYT